MANTNEQMWIALAQNQTEIMKDVPEGQDITLTTLNEHPVL